MSTEILVDGVMVAVTVAGVGKTRTINAGLCGGGEITLEEKERCSR